jgi:hypothetical protein
MSRKCGASYMSSGSQIKTSYCPADSCDKSWTGNPRTVNKMKELHLKVCPLITCEIERIEHLKCRNLNKITSGAGRSDYVKASEKITCLDQKDGTKEDLFRAFLFNSELKNININEKKGKEK